MTHSFDVKIAKIYDHNSSNTQNCEMKKLEMCDLYQI